MKRSRRRGRAPLLDARGRQDRRGGRGGGEDPRLRRRTCRSSRSAAPAPRWRREWPSGSGARCCAPDHPEVLSSIGAALSLVRAEIVRHCSGPGATAALARDAERACVDAGAAPMTVTVTAKFEARDGWLRAVATGAVALESGAAGPRAARRGRRSARSPRRSTGAAAEQLRIVASTGYYRVFTRRRLRRRSRSSTGSGRSRSPSARGASSWPTTASACSRSSRRRSTDGTTNLGVGSLLPRVCVVAGAHVVDLSDSRRAEDILTGAAAVLERLRGPGRRRGLGLDVALPPGRDARGATAGPRSSARSGWS